MADFSITPADEPEAAFELTPTTPLEQPAGGRMGRFLQIRVNGVDLGDDKVEVLDFIVPGS